ncbi:hypothetical protein [Clostridium sp. JN-1]|uniref:hypothetical protein n=1 Tax=Clostridium sp. JN-1 TaxID=2483110 RepID=UPI000F0B02B6|nr:hypothetical protein [Clostridium sp. JN-1]
MKSSGAIDIYDETEFHSWVKMINVTLAEKNYCSMIEEHSSEMNNRKNINKDKYLENLPFNIRWKLKGEIYTYSNVRKTVVLDIDTSEKMRDKTYSFMSGFINSIYKIGGEVYVDNMQNADNTIFTLLESRYKCRLYEKQVKLRDKIKIEERKMRPLYDLEYTGDLCFQVFGEEINKKDTWKLLQTIEFYKSHTIENKLIDLFYKLREDAISKKIIIDQEMAKQQQERKKEIKQWEEEKMREDQAHKEKEKLLKKQKMQEKIKNHIDKWENINKVLEYVNDLRNMSGISDNKRKLILKYCDYVEKTYSKSEFYEEILEFSQNLEL